MQFKSMYREYCYGCYRPASVCLCSLIEPFMSQIRFVILMHPREARREKNGTGRLCHRVLSNSRLQVGVDFTDDEEVNELIADPEYQSVLLFPAPNAINLSRDGYRALALADRKLQIFVVDGTWALARKILRLSGNISALPAVSFTLRRPSNFRIKKQPAEECLSTIESIHLLLELAREQGVENTAGNLKQLPAIFDRLVDIQIECAARSSGS